MAVGVDDTGSSIVGVDAESSAGVGRTVGVDDDTGANCGRSVDADVDTDAAVGWSVGVDGVSTGSVSDVVCCVGATTDRVDEGAVLGVGRSLDGAAGAVNGSVGDWSVGVVLTVGVDDDSGAGVRRTVGAGSTVDCGWTVSDDDDDDDVAGSIIVGDAVEGGGTVAAVDGGGGVYGDISGWIGKSISSSDGWVMLSDNLIFLDDGSDCDVGGVVGVDGVGAAAADWVVGCVVVVVDDGGVKVVGWSDKGAVLGVERSVGGVAGSACTLESIDILLLLSDI